MNGGPERKPAGRMVIGLLAAALVLVAAGAAVAGLVAPEPVTHEALARSEHPRGAPDRALGLSRVVIQPGAKLALHHHEGTQIARIEHGTLTYTVHTGEVKVRKGDAEANPRLVRTIEAGETAPIKSGQWIVEQPSDHHSAKNAGDAKIVIYLATLLRTGAPPSTPG